MQINDRQKEILKFLENSEQKGLGISGIFNSLKEQENFQTISKITVNRDLVKLLENNFLQKIGEGRGTKYLLSEYYQINKNIDIEKYFQQEVRDRKIKSNFDFSVYDKIGQIFTTAELEKLEKLNQQYLKNKSQLSDTIIKKEFERLTIELSWKSAKIEGNTYTLLESEFLIKYGKFAEDKSKSDAQMILNHKNCIDYIFSHQGIYEELSIAKIENIHSILTEKLAIAGGVRKVAVGITGTKYRPLDNQFQIREALEKLVLVVNQAENYFAKVFLILIFLPYIQAFEDGNKRTGRLTATAFLIGNNLCPLSFRDMNEVEYKKALLLFYEQNNINYLKKIFIEQFEDAVGNYFN